MGEDSTKHPAIFLRCTHTGVIQEIHFLSSGLSSAIAPGTALSDHTDVNGRETLSGFLRRAGTAGLAQETILLASDSGAYLQASIIGQQAGNHILLSGTVTEPASAPGAGLVVTGQKMAFAGTQNWLALPQLETENAHLRRLLQMRDEILNSSSDVVFLLSPNGNITYVNSACRQTLGCQPAEMPGKNLLDIICPDDHDEVRHSVQKALSQYGRAEFRCRVNARDGEQKEMAWKVQWSGSTHMLYAIAHDISAYNSVSEKLKKNKKQLREAQRLARIGNLEVDAATRQVYFSEMLAEILGFGQQVQVPLEVYLNRIHPDDLGKIQNAINDSPPETKTLKINYRFSQPNGEWLHLRSHAVLQRDHTSEVVRYISKVQDVTEQFLIEEALRLEKQHTRMIIETAIDAFIGIDQEGIITDWNCSAETTFCIGKAAAIGKPASKVLLTPDGGPVFDARILSLMDSCETSDVTNSRFERTIQTTDGNSVKVEISATCFGFNDQIFLNAFIRDVTKQSKADELLRQSERRFRALVQSGADMIALLTPEGVYQYVSHNVISSLGYHPEDMVGRNAVDFFHPDDREKALQTLHDINLIEDKVVLPAFRFRNSAGKYVWMETTVTNLLQDPSVGALVANSRDITQKKKAEEEKQRLAAIIEATSDAVGILDPTGRVLHLNDAFLKQLGISLTNEQFRNIRSFHPDWAFSLIIETAIPEAIKNGIWTGETAMLSSDGKEVPFSLVLLSHKNERGKVEYLSAIARNISDRKELELALRESKERYKSLFDHNPDGVFALDWDGNSMSINNSLAKMLEIGSEEMTPEHFTKYVAPHDVEHALKYFEISKKANTATFDIQLVTKTGKPLTVQITTTPIMVEGELEGVYGIAKDITEKYRLDEALRQSNEQLRALTAHIHLVREEERKFIAREIHDELGQQLTALKIDISLLAKKVAQLKDAAVSEDLGKELSSMLEISDETIHCIRKLVKTLRPMAIEDLGLVSEIRSRLQKFGEMLDIETELDIDLEELPFSSDQALDFFRIFQESLTNISRHAGATKVVVKIRQTGDAYRMEITDNGTGIPKSKLESSDSFGLLGIRERAYKLNGDLKIKALPKGGTSVILTIPVKHNTQKIFEQSDMSN